MSDEEMTLERRKQIREQTRRRRRGAQMITLLLIVVPIVLAWLYGEYIAAPRFVTESRFTVRSLSPQSDAGAMPSMLNASGGGGFVDGWAVRDYLESREAMRDLDLKIGLAKHLTYTGLDPLSQLSANANDDELYRAYRAAVTVNYNMLEQINVITVNGLTPEAAVLISQTLLDLAGDFVNRMDEKGVRDALQVSKKAVDLAEVQSLDALAALTAWRRQHGNIDPTTSATMLLNLESQLEGELATAQINLEKIRAMDNPAHPMLRPAQMQISALERRLQDVRKRLSGAGDTQAAQLESFEKIKNLQIFAQANLTMARQNYQQAFTDTLRMRRYLSLISQPIVDYHVSNLTMLLLQGLAIGLVLALLRGMITTIFRGWRHA